MNIKKSIIMLLLVVISITVYAISDEEDFHSTQVVSQEKTLTSDTFSKAVLENNIELVNKIIRNKTVDINKKDSNGQYPIEMVLVMNNCEMAKILLESGANPYVATANGEVVYDIVMKKENKTLKNIFKKYSK